MKKAAIIPLLLLYINAVSQGNLTYNIVDLGEVGPPLKHKALNIPQPFLSKTGILAYSIPGPISERDELNSVKNEPNPVKRGCKAIMVNLKTGEKEEITIPGENYLEVIGIGIDDQRIFLRGAKATNYEEVLRDLDEMHWKLQMSFYQYLNGSITQLEEDPRSKLADEKRAYNEIVKKRLLDKVSTDDEEGWYVHKRAGQHYFGFYRQNQIFYTHKDSIIVLPRRSSDSTFLPLQINNKGHLLGVSSRYINNEKHYSLIFIGDEKTAKLTDLITNGSGWNIDNVYIPGPDGTIYEDHGGNFSGYGLSNDGLITGIGKYQGLYHAFYLIPNLWPTDQFKVTNQYQEDQAIALEVSHPSPVVSLEKVKILRVSDGVATIEIRGHVTSVLSQIVADGKARIDQVQIQFIDSSQESQLTTINVPVKTNMVGTEDDFRPYGSVGSFESEIEVPLFTGSTLVNVGAMNLIGRWGFDSFTCSVDDSAIDAHFTSDTVLVVNHLSEDYITEVIHHESTKEGLVNLSLLRVPGSSADFYGNQEVIEINGSTMPLKLNDVGNVVSDRPIIIVSGEVRGDIPNVISLDNSDQISIKYKTDVKTFDISYTAHSPPNYYKYAAGTKVSHKVFIKGSKEWNLTGLTIEKRDQPTVNWYRDTSIKAELREKRRGDEGVVLTIDLDIDKESDKFPYKRVKLFIREGDELKEVVLGSFQVTKLKTVIISVDGFAYASSQTLIEDEFAPGLTWAFDGSANQNEPALAALPTITWTNWPGIFSGSPPGKHGITGNSFMVRERKIARPFNSGHPLAKKMDGFRATIGIFNGLVLPNTGSIYDNMAMTSDNDDFRGASIHQWYNVAHRSLIQRYYFSTVRNIMTYDLKLKAHDASAAIILDLLSGIKANQVLNSNPEIDVLTVYFPGPDNIAHSIGDETVSPPHKDSEFYTKGPALPDVRTPLVSIQEHAENFTDDYIRSIYEQLSKSGYLYASLFVLVSDHGLHSYHNRPPYNITMDGGMKTLFKTSGYKPFKDFDKLYFPRLNPNKIFAINRSDIVFSPNGGMAQFYLRDFDKAWEKPASKATIERLLRVLYMEAVGGSLVDKQTGSVSTYPDYKGVYTNLAPKKNPVATQLQLSLDYGAMGSPPALFAKVGGTNSFLSDYQWVKSVPINPNSPIKYGTIEEFIEARKAIYSDFDWPEFKERLKEFNHKGEKGSRTGDILMFMDGRMGYMAILDGDELNGWHGGATISESLVPLMFNIPGSVVEEDFIHQAVEDVRKSNGEKKLRNWQMGEILKRIYTTL